MYGSTIRLATAAFSLSLMVLLGCSDSTGPAPVTVSIQSHRSSIQTGDTLTLFASVNNRSNQDVAWELIPGPSDYGTLTPAGFYTAPKSLITDSIFVRMKVVAVGEAGAFDTTTIVVHQGPLTHIVPNLESSYTFTSYRTDATGAKEAGSEKTWTETLKDLNASVAEKGNLALFTNGVDTTYLRYEANGDLFLGSSMPEWVGWITYPFGSHTSATITLPERTVELRDKITGTATISYLGTEVVPVTTKSVLGRKVHEVRTETRTGVISSVTTTTSDIWYAPAIGHIVKVDRSIVVTEGTSTTTTGSKTFMTSYILR